MSASFASSRTNMNNLGISDNSASQNLQGNGTLNTDIITELRNSHYESQMTDTTDLTSVFIEYDANHDKHAADPESNQLENPGAG